MIPASFADLAYPPDALAARVTGRVVVRITAGADGRVVGAESLSGPDALAPAAVANAKAWTLPPGSSGGIVVYRFEIDRSACRDDSRGLFRLTSPNLAVITACSRPDRAMVPVPQPTMPLEVWSPPIYPAIALSARVSGVIALDLSLDRHRRVVVARPLNDFPLLTGAAVETAKTWRFQRSASRRGVVVLEFSLDDRICRANEELWLSPVTADYWRISACAPIIDAQRTPASPTAP